MNGYSPQSYNNIVRGKTEGRHDWEIAQFDLANHLFRRALLLGQLKRLWRWLTRRPSCLFDPAGLEENLRSACEQPGVMPVAIGRIRGSEGRCADFDRDFFPRRESSRCRWVAIAAQMMQGHSLPAVELIQVGEVYFVRDGHHRISAARMLGQTHIDARVTLWQLSEQPAGVPAGAFLSPMQRV